LHFCNSRDCLQSRFFLTDGLLEIVPQVHKLKNMCDKTGTGSRKAGPKMTGWRRVQWENALAPIVVIVFKVLRLSNHTFLTFTADASRHTFLRPSKDGHLPSGLVTARRFQSASGGCGLAECWRQIRVHSPALRASRHLPRRPFPLRCARASRTSWRGGAITRGRSWESHSSVNDP
jgi:hypothetical protein